MRSMTAYGSFKVKGGTGSWHVEIHSVNRKMLDVNIQLPKELLFLDTDLRAWLAQDVFRGQVTLRVYHTLAESTGEALSSLKALKAKWEQIASALGMEVSREITLPFLLSQAEANPFTVDEEAVKKELKECFEKALAHFLKMREKEGAALVKDLCLRLEKIRKELKEIEGKTHFLAEKYREKMQAKLVDLHLPLDEERILREVVLYAEKVDISEEVVRLFSHLHQFESLLTSSEKGVGKTLDFLIQEMGREINTLGAKAAETEISKKAVFMKSELEKIREQVQNIE